MLNELKTNSYAGVGGPCRPYSSIRRLREGNGITGSRLGILSFCHQRCKRLYPPLRRPLLACTRAMPTGMRRSCFSLRVQLLSGAEMKVTCRRDDTIACLRRKVAAAVSRPVHTLHLFDVSGQELIDRDSLTNAGLRRSSIINLVCDVSNLRIAFRVNLPSGHEVSVHMRATVRIIELKRKLYFLTRTSEQFIHVFDDSGRELESNATLAVAGVTQGDMLHLVLDDDNDEGPPPLVDSSDEEADGPPSPLVDSSDEEVYAGLEAQQRGVPHIHAPYLLHQ